MNPGRYRTEEHPLVSILIVTYNAVKDLPACLASIKAQAYPALQVVIVDGGSRDGTLELIQDNSEVIDFYISEADDGIYDAMNKGLDYLKGDWVYFLGADDTLLPGFSDMLFHTLKDPGAIYYGSTIFKGEKYKGHLSTYTMAKIGINHQAMIYPMRVFRKYRFDTRYRIAADRILNLWCLKDPEFHFEFVDYILANFNHTGVSSLEKDPLYEKQKYRLAFKYYGPIIGLRFWFKSFKDKYIRKRT